MLSRQRDVACWALLCCSFLLIFSTIRCASEESSAKDEISPDVAATENDNVRLNSDGTERSRATSRDLYASDYPSGSQLYNNAQNQAGRTNYGGPMLPSQSLALPNPMLPIGQGLPLSLYSGGIYPSNGLYAGGVGTPYLANGITPYQLNGINPYQLNGISPYLLPGVGAGLQMPGVGVGNPYLVGAGLGGVGNPYLYGGLQNPYSLHGPGSSVYPGVTQYNSPYPGGVTQYAGGVSPYNSLQYNRNPYGYNNYPVTGSVYPYADPYHTTYPNQYNNYPGYIRSEFPYHSGHHGSHLHDGRHHSNLGRHYSSRDYNRGGYSDNHPSVSTPNAYASQNQNPYNVRGSYYDGANRGVQGQSSLEVPSLLMAPTQNLAAQAGPNPNLAGQVPPNLQRVPYGYRQRRLGTQNPNISKPDSNANINEAQSKGTNEAGFVGLQQYPVYPHHPQQRGNNRSMRRTLNRLYNTEDLRYEPPRKPVSDERPRN